MRATLTDEMDAPKFVYEARDALMTKLAEVRAAIPNEFTVLNPDMRQITDVVRALDAGAKAAEKLRKDLLKILYKAESKLDKGHITETATEVVKFARKLVAAGRAGTIAPAVVAHLVGDDSMELLQRLIELEEDEDNDKD